MIRQLILLFVVLFFQAESKAQTDFSCGVGANSSLYFLETIDSDVLPSIPVSPYITIKIKRHETLFGLDLYPLIKGTSIIGGQLGYRYHFLKKDKPLNLFIDCNFQFVKLMDGCGGPVNYDSPTKDICFDGAIYKRKSIVNTYGLGLQVNLKNRFVFYSIVGAGYNVMQQEIYRNWTGYELKTGTLFAPTMFVRAGIAVFVFNKDPETKD
jgi:hypothetical protein